MFTGVPAMSVWALVGKAKSTGRGHGYRVALRVPRSPGIDVPTQPQEAVAAANNGVINDQESAYLAIPALRGRRGGPPPDLAVHVLVRRPVGVEAHVPAAEWERW